MPFPKIFHPHLKWPRITVTTHTEWALSFVTAELRLPIDRKLKA